MQKLNHEEAAFIWAGVTHSSESKRNGKGKLAIFHTEPGTWSVLRTDDRVSGAQQRAHGLHGRSLRSRRWALRTDGLYQKARLPRSQIKRQSPLIPLSPNCGETFATGALLPLSKAGSMPPTGDEKAPGSSKLRRRAKGATRAHRAPRRRQHQASGGRAGGGQALEPAAARGRSAGGAGPGACARTSHSGARGRPLASRGGRPARAIHPPPAPRVPCRRVPNGRRPSAACALRAYQAGAENRAAAPHRVDAPPLPHPPPPPEQAAASDRRRRRGGSHGGPRPARTETEPTSARPRRGRSCAPGAAASPAPSEE